MLRILERAGKKGRLWIAVTYRDEKAVRKLLARGADPLYHDEMRDLTVFRQAALCGDVEIVRALAEALDAEMEQNGGSKAFFAAVVKGNKEVVSFLVDRGADPNIRDECGR